MRPGKCLSGYVLVGIAFVTTIALALTGCESQQPNSIPHTVGDDPLAQQQLKLPYPRDAKVYWSGGPHEFGNQDFEGIYPLGRGSGLDFSAAGQTDEDKQFQVLAMAPGYLLDASGCDKTGFGCRITIQTRFDPGHDLNGTHITYAHLAEDGEFQRIRDAFNNAVSLNQRLWIDQGTVLGLAGRTGNQPEVHLHVELEDANRQPMEWHGAALVDGYVIYSYLADNQGVRAYNYDGSAVKHGTRTLSFDEFYYNDYPSMAPVAPQAVQVGDQFTCTYPRNPAHSCELENSNNENTRFAVGTQGDFTEVVSADGFSEPVTLPDDTYSGLDTTDSADTAVAASSYTVLVIDTSGSMDEVDTTGVTKLQAAINAGTSLLNVINAESTAGTSKGQSALVTFSDFAAVQSPLSSDVSLTASELHQMYAGGGTALSDGLKAAVDMLATSASGAPKIVVLLTDGLPNVGLNGDTYLESSELRAQALALARDAERFNVCVYTIGLGVPGQVGELTGEPSLDGEFLEQIASASGCGSYYTAANSAELASVYTEIHHASTGNILLSTGGQISQDQSLVLGNVEIPNGTPQLLYTLNWPGSQIDPLLTDPNGVMIDSSYETATIALDANIASVVVSDPIPGQWQVSARGTSVPNGITSYNAIVSARPVPQDQVILVSDVNRLKSSNEPIYVESFVVAAAPSAFPVVLIVVLIGGSLVGSYAFMRRTLRRSKAISEQTTISARLIGTTGMLKGATVSIRQDHFTLGRTASCDLKLDDLTVSRLHANIRYADNNWFIRDLNSSGGTYVNGRKVQAHRLSSGDEIRIGSTTLRFYIDP